jgi:hypothetical protein
VIGSIFRVTKTPVGGPTCKCVDEFDSVLAESVRME